jgi:endonuclease/exonuclease/phosphatase family metal-dependent hydrolase
VGNSTARMIVLTWNLFHGRAVPPAGRSLQREFAAALAGWEWDVALLQECPPWWPEALAVAAAAEYDVALTSRNCLLPARRWAAERWPDLMRSGGGSSNAILVRGGERIAARARRRLRLWPERRVVHAVRLEPSGVWVANLHAQVHSQARAEADLALAARSALGWAGPEAPVVLGGDLNQRHPSAEGFAVAGGHGVDHVLVRGLEAEGRVQTPERGPLSDHAPVSIAVRRHPG